MAPVDRTREERWGYEMSGGTVGGVPESSEERQSMKLARQRLLENRSEWRQFLSRPLQRVRECISDLA